MKLLASLLQLAFAGCTVECTQKTCDLACTCSELCGGGIITDGVVEQPCNREPCSVYDNSLFQNSHMEDTSNYHCNGGCQLGQGQNLNVLS